MLNTGRGGEKHKLGSFLQENVNHLEFFKEGAFIH